jgi:hypothetical protein
VDFRCLVISSIAAEFEIRVGTLVTAISGMATYRNFLGRGKAS